MNSPVHNLNYCQIFGIVIACNNAYQNDLSGLLRLLFPLALAKNVKLI